jgi:hypothetical protein
LKITEQISANSIFRSEKGREQRNSGTVFPYFAINIELRDDSILQFRYLMDSPSRQCRQRQPAFADYAAYTLLYANYDVEQKKGTRQATGRGF